MAIKIPLQLLNIEGDGFHLQAKVKVNGKPALMIIDTGASRTVFDKTELEKFLKKEEVAENDRLSTGLGTSSMQSQIVTLGSFAIGKLQLKNFPAVVLDLQHVNQTYSQIGFSSIVGVLGSDVLVGNKAIINFHKKTMTLTPPRKTVKKRPAKKIAKKKTRK